MPKHSLEILKQYGFHIDTAENGAEALEKISAFVPGEYDLVIAMTANAFDEDRKAALDCSMNGFISKPIDLQEVVQVLRDVIAQ